MSERDELLALLKLSRNTNAYLVDQLVRADQITRECQAVVQKIKEEHHALTQAFNKLELRVKGLTL